MWEISSSCLLFPETWHLFETDSWEKSWKCRSVMAANSGFWKKAHMLYAAIRVDSSRRAYSRGDDHGAVKPRPICPTNPQKALNVFINGSEWISTNFWSPCSINRSKNDCQDLALIIPEKWISLLNFPSQGRISPEIKTLLDAETGSCADLIWIGKREREIWI
jgi:hypothetical protein